MPDDHHRIFNSNYRYFNHLRQLLIDKILVVKNRTTSVSDKNRQTKTFIRFCSRPHVIYLGYYFACGFVGNNNQCCQQPAAVVLSHNRRKCNNHLPSFIIHGNKRRRTGKLPQNPSFYVHNHSYIPHNHAKEVHSTRLGISYDVIIRRYNEWKGKHDFYLQNVMELTSTKTKKGVATSHMYYKEYHNFALDANCTQQQIKWWNRLKFSIFKSERSLGQVKPFLINEHSYVYKKIQHAVEQSSQHIKCDWKIENDKTLRKRIKNWKHRVKMRNKKKKTKRSYLKYQNSLHSRLPPIVEDKVIESNNNNQATFFLDKLIMDFHRAHFAPITPTRQQYPSTPKLDHLQSIKDNDERPIRKPRKRKIKLSPTPGHDQ
ncbi:hypothetical protein GLOIN_2v1782152 [Rhizophagus irregularis DAOM 181602=DAOM 197198]|uniref:Uncharacterized protein n=1 Tax=Rhizophagus irregularis (strain DAOM 181602 / DAOM 197198 / MUCL 43194) TaxID=747089 RepID=A0A2P4PI43_RHIID|nr:hypothetical protein GLOIN_2v1782152 [Rhizophagus irregularis DAOM 181602=DAOM 197198]POG65053.1 hypothetical protein GLOIN_2v1782152 [Rhizophagus irregularis DAOM 181602=DAOM 197198]|eukprot:XP_025171919.1 hypothetical protein GLOIN_2v1782152 [Rhizophagus irregularis DAOM 181602=DAOM 197198]